MFNLQFKKGAYVYSVERWLNVCRLGVCLVYLAVIGLSESFGEDLSISSIVIG